MAKGNFWKALRISILLLILAGVGLGTYLSGIRTTDWNEPLWVAVYPINGDASEKTANYIAGLTQDRFVPIENFMRREAGRYALTTEDPVIVKLRSEVNELPPEAPAGGNVLSIMWWSLKLRYWANKMERQDPELPGDIRMFVIYYDPDANPSLNHSLGLKKGLIGVVHAFASKELGAKNNVVITHEMLHTLGATDKYGDGNLPDYPSGYAEPEKEPLYPQKYAEIMGGRIPKTQTDAVIPPGLKLVRVGNVTAGEINWTP